MSGRRLRITLIDADTRRSDDAASMEIACDGLRRMIAAGWRGQSGPPAVEPMPLSSALLTDADEFGSIVVVRVGGGDPEESRGGLFRLFDRLDDHGVPIVVMASSVGDLVHRMVPEGGIALDERMDPAAGCAALAALLARQGKIEQLRKELSTARRFQGGLRTEIERMHDELQLAASVQREFLPQEIPETPGVEVGVLYRPCGYVSGDIYDVQRIDDEHLGVFIADAAGHGVPAALMTMVMARSLVTRRHLGDGGHEIIAPREVLATLNREMIRRHGDAPRFATAVYAVVNWRTLRVRAACAGHPMPLLYTPDARRDVPAAGSLLGVFEQAEFDEAEVTLGPDDLLVLHSDGFETAFPDQRASSYERRLPTMSYIERFAAVAESFRGRSLRGGIDALGEAIASHAGSLHQVDDLTALFIAPRRIAGESAGRTAA